MNEKIYEMDDPIFDEFRHCLIRDYVFDDEFMDLYHECTAYEMENRITEQFGTRLGKYNIGPCKIVRLRVKGEFVHIYKKRHREDAFLDTYVWAWLIPVKGYDKYVGIYIPFSGKITVMPKDVVVYRIMTKHLTISHEAVYPMRRKEAAGKPQNFQRRVFFKTPQVMQVCDLELA